MREIDENLCLGFGCRGKGFFAKVSDDEFLRASLQFLHVENSSAVYSVFRKILKQEHAQKHLLHLYHQAI